MKFSQTFVAVFLASGAVASSGRKPNVIVVFTGGRGYARSIIAPGVGTVTKVNG